MSLYHKLLLATAYARARRLDLLSSRHDIEATQQRWLEQLKRYVTARSPFYSSHRHTPWSDWPLLDKTSWMSNFDEINTVGATRTAVTSLVCEAETSRNFAKRWGQYTVGQSTGTSGNRGIFIAGPAECAIWAGTLLGKLLDRGLLARERIALVLRAGATLYEAVAVLGLQFRFFDQSTPWDLLVHDLEQFQPSILVAPASALRILAASADKLRPRRIISVAEVLDSLDRSQIQQKFELRVEQIYQATEGLLGTSCAHDMIHLNEPYILVEQEWLDADHSRFSPVVTDLWRRTQPVIRYRLNDVLQVAPQPCACGRAALAISAIEGRRDDVLWLPGVAGRVPVFPDVLARVIIAALPEIDDYQIDELEAGVWRIGLAPIAEPQAHHILRTACAALAVRLHAVPPVITVATLKRSALTGKQRRIRGPGQLCAS